ncbi:DUF4349 domain-containing protein [Cellulomonas hominis]
MERRSGAHGVAEARMRRGVLGLVLVLGVLLAGCTSDRSADADSAAQAPAADSQAGGGSAERTLADGPVDAGGDTSAASGRQVVVHADVQVTVDDPRAAAARVVALVEDAGGRVDAREEYSGSEGSQNGLVGEGDQGTHDVPRTDASATLTVRVPSADLTGVLEDLADIGEVSRLNQTTDDVTTTAQDLDARIDALEISVARMEDLLGRAASTTELLEVEAALSERQGTLESLESQRASLAEEVALSTLTVTLTTVPPEPVADDSRPGGFLDGLSAGWDALYGFLRGTVLVLGALLPWLALGGLITLAVVGVGRMVDRRHGRPGADAATPGAADPDAPASESASVGAASAPDGTGAGPQRPVEPPHD